MREEQPRKTGFKTILRLLKRRRILLIIGLLLTIIPVYIGITLLTILSALDADAPAVDYELIDKSGSTTKAIITNTETQENITINNDHPSVINYYYTVAGKKVESNYKVLALKGFAK